MRGESPGQTSARLSVGTPTDVVLDSVAVFVTIPEDNYVALAALEGDLYRKLETGDYFRKHFRFLR